jgi:hypothetical protein
VCQVGPQLALDDDLRLRPRDSVGKVPLRIDDNVEASCPHAHHRSIRGIELSIQPMRLTSCSGRCCSQIRTAPSGR